jgi:hypothetical protein
MNIEREIMKNVSFLTVLVVIGWTLVGRPNLVNSRLVPTVMLRSRCGCMTQSIICFSVNFLIL